MPINILGESRYPQGYRSGPGLDSKGRAGPTLQRIADEHKTRKNNASLLEAVFEILAPLGMYSGDAEAIHLPSKTMTNAKTLASLFQDWFKGGTPTINVPFDTWPEIIRSNKFKNQMELAGKKYPEAWKQRIEVEKKLGGFPYPQVPIGRSDMGDAYYADQAKNIRKYSGNLSYEEQLKQLKKLMLEREAHRKLPTYSESLAKQNPIYGHIYNKKYNDPWDATGFGETHAEMTDLIKDQSKYVLGDSFHPFVKTAFSSDDMLGNTSRLERALFDRVRNPFLQMLPEEALKVIKTNPKQLSNLAQYMEMWVPNHLARLNNVKSVHVPGKSLNEHITSRGEVFDRAVPVNRLNELQVLKNKNNNALSESLKSPLELEPWDAIDKSWKDALPLPPDFVEIPF